MTQLYVQNPSVNFFSKKINDKKTFFFSKISIEFWDLMQLSVNDLEIDITPFNLKDLNDDKFIKKLSNKMVEIWNNGRNLKRPWIVSADSFYRIIKMMTNGKEDGFLLGVNRHGHCITYFEDIKTTLENYTEIDKKNNKLSNFMFNFLNKINNRYIYNAICWKYWASNGKIDIFFNKIKNNKIVIIGPLHLKNFGAKLKLDNFDYIKIPDRDACIYTKQISNKIINYHDCKEYTIYIIQGGAAAMDITTMLHKNIFNCCILDMGRAMDIYYYYDPIKNKFPKWYWGNWADKNPPVWLKNRKL